MHCNFVTMDCISGDIIISDVTFTVDTGDRASPQFTLTCISTGGPATNVTWTTDSDTVTEGTETVLDNFETAQYNHTNFVTMDCISGDIISSDGVTFTVDCGWVVAPPTFLRSYV